jgi:hypothetical protein
VVFTPKSRRNEKKGGEKNEACLLFQISPALSFSSAAGVPGFMKKKRIGSTDLTTFDAFLTVLKARRGK